MKLLKPFATFANALVLLSLTNGQLSDPFSVKVGDEVCFEGYIMDGYCIGEGFLFDNPDVVSLSLEGPGVHTAMCLLDVPACNASNFEILMEPNDGSKTYIRAFQFDDEHGKEILLSVARGACVCGTCDGGGTVERGFRAEIRGTVVTARDGETPALVELQSVQPSNNLTEVCQNTGDDGDNKSAGSSYNAVHVLSALSFLAMGNLLTFSIL